MRYGKISHYQTGVAIPVFSLRSKESVGIGDFLDLVPFAEFVAKTGLDLIQLLPVNDTGEESSPYSARSAFALNPAYIRLQAVEGIKPFLPEVKELQKKWTGKVPYFEAARAKKSILRKIFDAKLSEIQSEKDLTHWIDENKWSKPYAAYCVLKSQRGESSWQSWEESVREPKAATVKTVFTKHADDCLFQLWMQWIAERQFTQAVAALDAKGIRIKGDIPILINEDSADVWYERKFFALDNRAGAPPDMFSYSGQNWGFPTYRWDILQKDHYRWWRDRLNQAAKFYHAYRIDHVLGFFRIWTVPDQEITGIMGKFQPSLPIARWELEQAGIGEGTIHYVTNPNFGWEYLLSLFGEQTQKVTTRYFDHIGNGRFLLKESNRSERAILAIAEEQPIKDAMLKVYWNRVFLPNSERDGIWPFWFWYDAPVLKTLPQHEQEALRRVINSNEASQEASWAENGRKLLKVMAEETDMLVCAEDLGVVPDCVPQVLGELNILSLRIERWSRRWKESGQPYIQPSEYPYLSVCTTSCHDSSTLAGLWKEPDFDREFYWKSFALPGKAPATLDASTAEVVLQHLLSANSLLAIPPLQDFLSLQPEYALRDPEQERVNIPGTVGSHNWNWCMPMTSEDLVHDKALVSKVKAIVGERKSRKV